MMNLLCVLIHYIFFHILLFSSTIFTESSVLYQLHKTFLSNINSGVTTAGGNVADWVDC